MIPEYVGDELFLEIEYIGQKKAHHHCEFNDDDVEANKLAVVACRHFGYAFGELRKVTVFRNS